MCSFPIEALGQGKWKIVQGLRLDEFGKKKVAATVAELQEERSAAAAAVGISAD
jgi:malate dehydrogenase